MIAFRSFFKNPFRSNRDQLDRWPAVLAALVIVSLVLLMVTGGSDSAQRKVAGEALPPGWELFPQTGAVLALAVKGDILWVGSKTGLHSIDRRQAKYLTAFDGGGTVTQIRSLLIDEQGVFWIGHPDGLTRMSKGTFKTFTVADGLPHNRVNALAQDRNGRIWVGTGNGLAQIVNDRPVSAPETSMLLSPIVNALLGDAGGNLWVGSIATNEGGITRLGTDGCQRFRVEDGLPHPYVAQFTGDADGTVWAATGFFERGGACAFGKNDSGWRIVKTLNKTRQLPEDHVRTLYRDSDGDLWLGFENAGMAVMSPAGVNCFSRDQGFPCQEVTTILQDSDGTLWLGTLSGVVRINRAAAEAFKSRLDLSKPSGINGASAAKNPEKVEKS